MDENARSQELEELARYLDKDPEQKETTCNIDSARKIADFTVKQGLPYGAKKAYASKRAREFYDDPRVDGNTCVSVGGLDSITLYVFLRSIGLDPVPVSVSGLEDASIQRVHLALGVQRIKPYKSKIQVLREFGFPVISKSKAKKISLLQQPDCEKQTFIHAIMTGDMGEQGHFEHSEKIKLPDKWLQKFAGYYWKEHRPDLPSKVAPFKVGADCCLWMKEKPVQDWQKEHGLFPYLGLMASEGGQRELGLKKNGCNYFGKDVVRSCPFAIFMRGDLLRLALEMDAYYKAHKDMFNPDPHLQVDSIIPKIYGKIVWDKNQEPQTTDAQRTGCSMCGFGIHMETRPHRFDRLWRRNPKEWEFWMYRCVTDETGTYGWGRVLDWIGVGWADPWVQFYETISMDLEEPEEAEE